MYYTLDSSKGGYIGDYRAVFLGVIKGDARSLDYGSMPGGNPQRG